MSPSQTAVLERSGMLHLDVLSELKIGRNEFTTECTEETEENRRVHFLSVNSVFSVVNRPALNFRHDLRCGRGGGKLPQISRKTSSANGPQKRSTVGTAIGTLSGFPNKSADSF